MLIEEKVGSLTLCDRKKGLDQSISINQAKQISEMIFYQIKKNPSYQIHLLSVKHVH